ncbi:hypothetical protein NC651_011230 [Populus alba x Populus x berolinensis]|nr:hypothetical protein NC651_011230 [Populus alba x Populus x berolinensis]
MFVLSPSVLFFLLFFPPSISA